MMERILLFPCRVCFFLLFCACFLAAIPCLWYDVHKEPLLMGDNFMNWGILATGTIANKFATTVNAMAAEGERLAAVGSRRDRKSVV